jgi:hypothetical protein
MKKKWFNELIKKITLDNMKFRIISLMMFISSVTYAQTPSKPTNPFPRKTIPAPTTKPTTQTPPSTNTIPTPSPSAPVVINPAPPDVKVNPPMITGTDEEQIMTTVQRVFYAMKVGDSSLLRPLFSPASILYTASTNAAGQNTLIQESIAAFIQSVGTPEKKLLMKGY